MELLRIELGAAVAASKAAEGRAETAAASAAQQQAALKSEIASLTGVFCFTECSAFADF